MYLTVQDVPVECIIGGGLGNGLGISGRRRAPLNLTIKKKHPRKTPCGAEPGRDLGEDTAPLKRKTMLLPVRYEIRILSSQPGTCMSCRSSITREWSTRLKALERSMSPSITAWGTVLSTVAWMKWRSRIK